RVAAAREREHRDAAIEELLGDRLAETAAMSGEDGTHALHRPSSAAAAGGRRATRPTRAERPLCPTPSSSTSSYSCRCTISSPAKASRSSSAVYRFSTADGPP